MCMLAAIRQSTHSADFWHFFDYAQEVKETWGEINAERKQHELNTEDARLNGVLVSHPADEDLYPL